MNTMVLVTPVIAALALVVSILSLGLSAYSAWQVRRKETPHAWAEIESTKVPNIFTATIKMRNPTQYFLSFSAVMVPIERIPVDEKQSFRLVEYGAFKGRTDEWVKENYRTIESGFKLQDDLRAIGNAAAHNQSDPTEEDALRYQELAGLLIKQFNILSGAAQMPPPEAIPKGQ
jgi:hypothetical protein